MEPKLPTDEDTNLFFDDVVAKLETDIGFSHAKASALAREFYLSFTNEEYCKNIGVGLHDDDLFFHEGVGGVALKIYYYLELQRDPDPVKFKEWRASCRD
jgi:hypothetical protein